MAAPIFQRTIVDSNGNVEIGASVEVRNEANNELAPIYVDRELTVAKANPFITDETGLAKFFVARGEYKVTATSAGSVIIWRYVQMLDTEFVASTDTAQTLTNKTISLANNTLVATSAQLRAAITDETGTGSAVFSISPALTGTPTVPTAAAGTNTTQAASTAHVFAERSNTLTLTNKTLTTPVLSATASGTTSGRLGYNSGALSYGTGSVQRTVVNTDEAQTLTNKTLTSPSITTPTGLVKADVGLGNVDNTADSAKSVASAATLTTARTIGGVSFNGSANINLPGVNTAGNQNTSGTAAVSTAATVTTSATASAFKVPFANTTVSTTGNYGLLQDSEATFTYNPSTNTLVVGTVSGALSGNATTATTLQTARTIGGVSFNGSANINLPGVNTTGNQNTTGTAANVTGTVAVANGGTGRTSLTTGNVVLGAGTSAVNFVAPGTSGNVLTSNGSTWVSSAAGGVVIASTAEAQAGTNNTNVITPLRMREGFNASGSAPVFACRAWVNFNGTGTVAIRASGNVSSITDLGTGRYRVSFSTAMPDTNYNFVFGGQPDADTVFTQKVDFNQSLSTTNIEMVSGIPTAATDGKTVCVAIFR